MEHVFLCIHKITYTSNTKKLKENINFALHLKFVLHATNTLLLRKFCKANQHLNLAYNDCVCFIMSIINIKIQYTTERSRKLKRKFHIFKALLIAQPRLFLNILSK